MTANGTPDPASLLIAAGVPAFKCPPGTKMHILNLGTLQADESWYVYSASGSDATTTLFC
jgi:hypothetical protein